MDLATVTSPNGFLTPILKPVVWHFGCSCFGFLEPVVSIFGRESEAVEGTRGGSDRD